MRHTFFLYFYHWPKRQIFARDQDQDQDWKARDQDQDQDRKARDQDQDRDRGVRDQDQDQEQAELASSGLETKIAVSRTTTLVFSSKHMRRQHQLLHMCMICMETIAYEK